MRLDFIIEASKFRHAGIFQIFTRSGAIVPQDQVIESLPVWFSSLEASGLRPAGLSSEAELQPDRWWGLSVSESIVFRYMRRLHDRFAEKKKIKLMRGEKTMTLIRLVNFNSLNVYHIAEVRGFS